MTPLTSDSTVGNYIFAGKSIRLAQQKCKQEHKLGGISMKDTQWHNMSIICQLCIGNVQATLTTHSTTFANLVSPNSANNITT